MKAKGIQKSGLNTGVAMTPLRSVSTLLAVVLLVSITMISCMTAPQPVVYDGPPEPALPGVILISEVASTGDFEFIELLNTSRVPAIFGKGWVISDDGTRYDDGERVFTIPEGTLIPARGYLLICPFVTEDANDVLNDLDIPQDALLDLSFKLQSEDAVRLYYQNRLVDELEWETDVNGWGYLEQGGTRIPGLLVPTPGAPNIGETISRVTKGIRLNEVNSVGFDFVEIVNTSERAVTLEAGMWTLTDIRRNRVYEIPTVTIPAAGYLTIYPSTHEPPYRAAVGAALAAQESEEINLGSADTVFLRYQGSIVDSYSWSHHVSTAGRMPDGSGEWETGLIPTPGSDNSEDETSE